MSIATILPNMGPWKFSSFLSVFILTKIKMNFFIHPIAGYLVSRFFLKLLVRILIWNFPIVIWSESDFVKCPTATTIDDSETDKLVLSSRIFIDCFVILTNLKNSVGIFFISKKIGFNKINMFRRTKWDGWVSSTFHSTWGPNPVQWLLFPWPQGLHRPVEKHSIKVHSNWSVVAPGSK